MSGIGPYNTDLAEHLVAHGHDVTVLTTFPHYPRYQWMQREGIYRSECINGVKVKRLRVVLPRRSNAFWRVVFDTSVGLSFVVNAARLKRPDVVVATVPTLQGGFVATLLAWVWRTRAVLTIQDLPVETGLAVGMLRQGIGLRLARRIEGMVFRVAHHCVVISEQFRESLIAKGVHPSNVTLIPNWVDLDRVRPGSPDAEVRRHLAGSPNGFILLHSGSMARKQGLHIVIEAARLLAAEDRIHIVLVGDGPAKADLERMVAIAQMTNVRIVGFQPTDYFPKMLAAADAVLLNQRADVVEAVAPSKLLHYLAAGRPVLAAVNDQSVAARIVAASGGGVVIRPEDPEMLANAVKKLSADPGLRAELGRRGRAYAEEMFARDRQLASWEAVVTTAANGSLGSHAESTTAYSVGPHH
jgi:colanic acid biosynthesis glycosyl transferase WcaI